MSLLTPAGWPRGSRRTSASNLTLRALGINPDDVVDTRGDGKLERKGPLLVLTLVVRDRQGQVQWDGDRVRTRTKTIVGP